MFPPPPRTRTYAPGETPDVRTKPAIPDRIEEPARTGPFVANTLGVDNASFPKPPPRHAGQSPPPGYDASSKPKPPSLPPRLPPRESESTGDESVSAATGYVNQGAVSRLGRAGISMDAFGIGSTKSPPVPPRFESTPVTARQPGNAQVDELQSKFPRLGTASPSSNSTGTSWADKKAALKTATSLKNDPSSVSFSDMKSAASTGKSFHDRHGAQVATGLQTANQYNQKYGLMDKVNNVQQPTSPVKKGPPPPPPKKASLSGPPIPMHSKPSNV